MQLQVAAERLPGVDPLSAHKTSDLPHPTSFAISPNHSLYNLLHSHFEFDLWPGPLSCSMQCCAGLAECRARDFMSITEKRVERNCRSDCARSIALIAV